MKKKKYIVMILFILFNIAVTFIIYQNFDKFFLPLFYILEIILSEIFMKRNYNDLLNNMRNMICSFLVFSLPIQKSYKRMGIVFLITFVYAIYSDLQRKP